MFFGMMKRSAFFRTIGARLTLWGAGVSMAVCALLCVLLYVGLYFALRAEIDAFLEGEVREFMVTVHEYANDDAGLERAIRQELGSRSRRDLAFRLFTKDGRLIVTSDPNDPLIDVTDIPSIGESKFVHQTVNVSGVSVPFRVCSRRVQAADGRWCVAQASYLLDRMTKSLVLFRRVCVVGMLLVTGLAIVAGVVLSRRIMKPIQLLTNTAGRIGTGNLGERVLLTGTNDELDQLASTINAMLDRIEHHIEQVQQFTADASHELRSPLAALRGSAEVALNRNRTAEELRTVIEDSVDHYDRLSRIAEDLLLLARADAGHQVMAKEALSIDVAVRSVIDLYNPLASDLEIGLHMDDCPTLMVKGDGARLRQLVGNLVDNAIKHTEPGGRIDVSLADIDEKVILTIRDTGCGIAREHLTRVFDRFYRTDDARSSQKGGAGLGLSICKVIAEAHGGSIDISSAPGQGTSVTVVVPSANVA